MQLPPLRGHPLLQHGLCHLPEAPIHLSLLWGAGCCCHVYPGNSHSQSFYLQSEKQGCEEFTKKGLGHREFFGLGIINKVPINKHLGENLHFSPNLQSQLIPRLSQSVYGILEITLNRNQENQVLSPTQATGLLYIFQSQVYVLYIILSLLQNIISVICQREYILHDNIEIGVLCKYNILKGGLDDLFSEVPWNTNIIETSSSISLITNILNITAISIASSIMNILTISFIIVNIFFVVIRITIQSNIFDCIPINITSRVIRNKSRNCCCALFPS